MIIISIILWPVSPFLWQRSLKMIDGLAKEVWLYCAMNNRVPTRTVKAGKWKGIFQYRKPGKFEQTWRVWKNHIKYWKTRWISDQCYLLFLPSATVVVERECFHKHVSRILSTGGCTPPRQTPPSPETASAVDGTHPTGMHSCWWYLNELRIIW